MGEIKESKKYVRVFLKNGFKFEGNVLSKDDKFLCILDKVTKTEKYLALDYILDYEVLKVDNTGGSDVSK